MEEKEGIKFLLGRKKYKMPEMPAVKKITLEIIGSISKMLHSHY